MTRIALALTIFGLAGCSDAPPPVAQAEDVYGSIRRAEVERARARPDADERPDQTSARSDGKSQL